MNKRQNRNSSGLLDGQNLVPAQQDRMGRLEAEVAPRAGTVIWITGLSGAGKSTIAREVIRQIRSGQDEANLPALMLDGDEFREAIADPNVGYDRASRLANALRISRMSRLLARQGCTVVVSTMSLFKEVHAWNREHFQSYLEVLVRVPLEVLERRDARQLYSKAKTGQAGHVVGIHVGYDEPRQPHLILENDGAESEVGNLAARVLSALREKRA